MSLCICVFVSRPCCVPDLIFVKDDLRSQVEFIIERVRSREVIILKLLSLPIKGNPIKDGSIPMQVISLRCLQCDGL
ncbi:hypothetical protein CHS0354_041701 [Potamilus streckersoni]|uniref:Uncharacterized protein n=1 Tax=Potamilus streckersoni TaxID=2493646 RepID=A0AAE0W517_9BIVA|nr:hypothetical protein CHS0354_041701 [Potamilus streckersoni]